MIRYPRSAAVAVAVACFAVWGHAGTAGADTNDERFDDAISALGITAAPGTDIPAIGRGVCDALTEQMATNPNPAPIVRGVVSTLEQSNMTRAQAVSFMRTSVAVYCPQHGRYAGR